MKMQTKQQKGTVKNVLCTLYTSQTCLQKIMFVNMKTIKFFIYIIHINFICVNVYKLALSTGSPLIGGTAQGGKTLTNIVLARSGAMNLLLLYQLLHHESHLAET